MIELIEKIGNLFLIFLIPSIYFLFKSISFSSMTVTNEVDFAKVIFFIGTTMGFRSLSDRDSFEFVVYLFGIVGILALLISISLFVVSITSGNKSPYIEAAIVISVGALSLAKSADY